MKITIPGLGFFGCTANDALILKINQKIKKIRIEIFEPNKEYLNLKNIEINSFKLYKNPVLKQSSFYSSKQKPVDLLRNKSIHTEKEVNPFWEVSYPSGMDVDSIKLFNRGDKWAQRSRNLIVSVLNYDNEYVVIYKGGSSKEANDLIYYFHETLGVNLSDFYSYEKIDYLKKKVSEAIKKNVIRSMSFYKQAIKLVDIWSRDDCLSSHEVTIVSGYLLNQEIETPNVNSIKMFSETLSSVEKLESIQSEMEVLCSANNLQSYGITRHGVQKKNILGLKTHENLEHLSKIIDTYKSLDYDIVICYGTLLGAVREGAFLKHDDDIDLMYFSEKKNINDVRLEILSLVTHFENLGYKVKHAVKRRLNIHIENPYTNVKVDVFACWKSEDEKINLHMHKMKIEKIDKDILFPSQLITLEGLSYPAPNDYKKFLLERYGINWHIEDPYYDWPWQLIDKKE